jgi:4'-phosphopantetheinyl transferase
MDVHKQAWCHPGVAGSPDLQSGEVHVWRARLSSSTAELSRRCSLLSSDEQKRADRFRFEQDRSRFILGRIIARSVLSHCLQQPAGDVQLRLDHLGKPFIPECFEASIHFNISHSGDYVLFAIARDLRVGVDVEQIRETKDLNDIAARYFSKNEYLRLLTVPERMRTTSFYRCWTMKEAYVKAHGEGFGLATDSFDVAFLPGEMPRLLETRFDHVDVRRWCFYKLDLGPAYLAALVTEAAQDLELKLWDWNGWQVNR